MGGMSMMAGHVEGRLAFLKTELKITDAQLPLWNAVAAAIRANGKSVSEMSGPMMGSMHTGTLPEKLAAREKMMTGHVEGRLAFLETELKITDAQLPLRNAVADAIRADAKTMAGMAEGRWGACRRARCPRSLRRGKK